MALDDVSPYRDFNVTDICQHVITCHRPCTLMLARVKMDEKRPGEGVGGHSLNRIEQELSSYIKKK